MKWMARLTTASVVLVLALPTAGCRQQEPEAKNGKGVDIQIDAGNTKVKVQGSTKPGEAGKSVDVEVERQPGHERQPGDDAK
jgi:hypothetical protein